MNSIYMGASNSTVTNSTTSYFDINFSSNMSYHEMINIISDIIESHNGIGGY